MEVGASAVPDVAESHPPAFTKSDFESALKKASRKLPKSNR